ncbi:MAG: precorrin-3B C(17)-methyltransferase, partial [Alphaproteobacteria bacterium]
ESETSETALVYAAKDLIVGVGCERGAEAETLVEAVQKALTDAQLDPRRVAGLVSVDLKQDEPALTALSEALDVPLRVFASDELKDVAVPNPSAVVQDEIGTPSVSEASALLGAGAGSALVLEKQKFGIGTVAVAQAAAPVESFDAGRARGQLQLVGLGPGREDWRLAGTDAVLRGADHLVGYTYYTDQVAPLPHQMVHTFDLGEEEKRCQFALDLAAEGKKVALICSGDAGVYAMGALVYELADRSEDRAVQGVEIIANPGISAMFGAAARLGAPLGHDFCAISLSNLMTPWTVIERRLKGAAMADFVVCFYNPVSRKRDWQLAAARDILLEERPAETPVVICRQIGRAEETYTHRTLGELDPAEVDMFCMVLVGSSITKRFQPVKNGPISLYTPRGYLARGEDPKA